MAVCACGWLWFVVLQRMVLEHVGSDTILVGHALENDLKALKVCGKVQGCAVPHDAQHSPAAQLSCVVCSTGAHHSSTGLRTHA